MTVCIAAICIVPRDERISHLSKTPHTWPWGIVMATDRQVTLGDPRTGGPSLKYDTGSKASPLALHWKVLISGDVTAARTIVSRARSYLHREESPFAPIKAQSALCRAYKAEREKRIEGEILGRLGYTFPMFRERGHEWLGDEEFARVNAQVESFDLGATLLVYGFFKDYPFLFTVGDPGVALAEVTRSYAAIGSGAWLTWGALSPLTSLSSLGETLYRVCEAKFFAERDPSVGHDMILSVMQPTGVERYMDGLALDEARTRWATNIANLPANVCDFLLESYSTVPGDPDDGATQMDIIAEAEDRPQEDECL